MSLNKGRKRVLELEVEKLTLEVRQLKEETKHLEDRLRLFESLEEDQNLEVMREIKALKGDVRRLYCMKKPWWRKA